MSSTDSLDVADMAVEYIRLMTPLLPPGRLAVRISGSPSTTEDHIAMKRVAKAASRARAHRSTGLVTVDVSFVNVAPSAHFETPQHLVVTIDSLDEYAKRRRVWVCVCFGAVLVILAVLHRRCARRDARRLVVIGEDVYA